MVIPVGVAYGTDVEKAVPLTGVASWLEQSTE
jgi:hypothetical protein